jgi:hypothetical protein
MKTGGRRGFSCVQNAHDRGFADLHNSTYGLLLNGSYPTGDIPLRWLRSKQIFTV